MSIFSVVGGAFKAIGVTIEAGGFAGGAALFGCAVVTVVVVGAVVYGGQKAYEYLFSPSIPESKPEPMVSNREFDDILGRHNKLDATKREQSAALDESNMVVSELNSQLESSEEENKGLVSELQSGSYELQQTKDELRSEKTAHQQTKDKLQNEKLAHQKTKGKLQSKILVHQQTKAGKQRQGPEAGNSSENSRSRKERYDSLMKAREKNQRTDNVSGGPGYRPTKGVRA